LESCKRTKDAANHVGGKLRRNLTNAGDRLNENPTQRGTHGKRGSPDGPNKGGKGMRGKKRGPQKTTTIEKRDIGRHYKADVIPGCRGCPQRKTG